MRPILWGILGSAIGAVGWVISVVLSALTLGRAFVVFANVFGILMPGGIVLGLIGEFFRWHRSRRRTK